MKDKIAGLISRIFVPEKAKPKDRVQLFREFFKRRIESIVKANPEKADKLATAVLEASKPKPKAQSEEQSKPEKILAKPRVFTMKKYSPPSNKEVRTISERKKVESASERKARWRERTGRE